ncbi:hypothetical protein [Parendozoicomonas sp. Alg238-R29]|uniref:hypothetical protein n=1 Tax=Parendozoicomonas sp. Alg238-R29 TaxID=2993446 RepID=UPI00248F1CC4|nr:hypothetical protein [Parendozoicomonas sp. Alg238-R29]
MALFSYLLPVKSLGQITLSNFVNPAGLNALGTSLFAETAASGVGNSRTDDGTGSATGSATGSVTAGINHGLPERLIPPFFHPCLGLINNLGKDALPIMDPLKNPGPVSLPPNNGVDIKGPVEAHHPTLGRVKPVDAQPLLAGKNLGKHLSGKSVKDWILTFFKHPLSTLHLASGQLSKLRNSDPVKYLGELSDLAAIPKDHQFLFNECCELKQGKPQQVRNQIEGWQASALPHLINIPGKGLTKTLQDTLALIQQFEQKPAYEGRRSELGAAFTTLSRRVHKTIHNAKLGELNALEDQLKQLDQKIARTSGESPFKSNFDGIQAKRNTEELENRKPPEALEQQPIDESQWPDELNEIKNRLTSDPGNPELWESFTELREAIQEEYPAETAYKMTEECLHSLHIAIPDSTLFMKHWVDHQLKYSPNSQDAWHNYDSLAPSLTPEEQIHYLSDLMEMNPENTGAGGRLLGVLQQEKERLNGYTSPEEEQEYRQMIEAQIEKLLATPSLTYLT